MDVKRYFMKATRIVERIGDEKCDCDTPCQYVVYATDFDAVLKDRDALQGKLKVAVEALKTISGDCWADQDGIFHPMLRTTRKRFADEALAQIGLPEKEG